LENTIKCSECPYLIAVEQVKNAGEWRGLLIELLANLERMPENGNIYFQYKNYKDETDQRKLSPRSIHYGSTQYHKKRQWIFSAFDFSKNAIRDFAVDDITPGTIRS